MKNVRSYQNAAPCRRQTALGGRQGSCRAIPGTLLGCRRSDLGGLLELRTPERLEVAQEEDEEELDPEPSQC